MSYYAYTPIEDDSIVLKLSDCKSLSAFHQRIKKPLAPQFSP